MNTFVSAIEYHPTAWSDVAFFAVIGLTIVGSAWAWAWNRRKP